MLLLILRYKFIKRKYSFLKLDVSKMKGKIILQCPVEHSSLEVNWANEMSGGEKIMSDWIVFLLISFNFIYGQFSTIVLFSASS